MTTLQELWRVAKMGLFVFGLWLLSGIVFSYFEHRRK